MALVVMDERGSVSLPEEIRAEAHLSSGQTLSAEVCDGAIILRPANAATLPEVEIYTDERKAEFLLNCSVGREDYLEARKMVEEMGLDPDRINHIPIHD